MAQAVFNGKLTVVLHKGQDLCDVQTIGKQDPYVKLSIGKVLHKSKVAESGGTKPVWEDKFEFDLDGSAVEVLLEVYDNNTLSDTFIGRAKIPIDTLVKANGQAWYRIGRDANEKTKAGDILIGSYFVDKNAKAQVQQQQQQQYAQPQQFVQQPQFVQQQYVQPQQFVQPVYVQPVYVQPQVIPQVIQPQVIVQQQPSYSKVSFQGPSGFYLGLSGSSVLAKSANAESFLAVPQGGSSFAFQASNGSYVSVGRDNSLSASAANVGATETFTVSSNGNKTVSIKGNNGRFVAAEPDGSAYTDRTSVGSWEQFKVASNDGVFEKTVGV